MPESLGDVCMVESLFESFKKFGDKSRREPYRCKLIGNNKFDCFILIWPPGSSTPIHDHEEASVTINVLSGSLIREIVTIAETYTEYTDRFLYKAGANIQEDGNAAHRVSNASFMEWALSFHTFRNANGKYMMREYRDVGEAPVLVDGDKEVTELIPIF